MLNSLSFLFATALRKTKRTFVLGAANKSEDREDTSQWSLQAFLISCNSLAYSCLYNDDEKAEWRLSSSDYSMHHAPSYSLRESVDPLLHDEMFKMNPELILIVKAALVSKTARAGNCSMMAHYTAHYLWSANNEDINKIDVVSLPGFDHVFVIVNDEWCLDPWANEANQLFHINDFNSHMIETLSYCITECELLAKEGMYDMEIFEKMRDFFDKLKSELSMNKDLKVLMTIKIAIDPKVTPYPKINHVKSDLTDYYAVSSLYAPWQNAKDIDYRKVELSLRRAHQKKMQPSLEKISTLST
jgi:hypothetical protein